MYKFTGFNEKANVALNNAVNAAEDLGHTYIGSEHLLLGILKDTTSTASAVLNSRGISYQKVEDAVKVLNLDIDFSKWNDGEIKEYSYFV